MAAQPKPDALKPDPKTIHAAAKSRATATHPRNEQIVKEVAKVVRKFRLPKSTTILHKTRRHCNQCGGPLYLARVQSLRTFFMPRFELLCTADDCRYHRTVRVISDE
jgi:hypothetical protein